MAEQSGGGRPDLPALLALATQLAKDASALLVDGLTRARSSVTTKSTSTDMVTEMDRGRRGAHRERHPHARDPTTASSARKAPPTSAPAGVRWVIDPIDGTTNYLYGLRGFGVSIAAEVDGDAVIGVVADPVRGDIYTATQGRRREPERQPHTRVRAHRPRRRRSSAPASRMTRRAAAGKRPCCMQVIPEVRDIRRFGAASLDLCFVASGRLDAYYEKGLSRWDYAAGALVAAEAGARLGDLDGGAPSSEFMLASATGLFEPLRDLLDRAGARDA